MQATLQGVWVKLPPTTRGTSSLPFSWFMWVVRLLASLWPSFFVSSLMVPTINLLLDFCVALSLPTGFKFQKERTSQYSSELRTCEGLQLSDFHKET